MHSSTPILLPFHLWILPLFCFSLPLPAQSHQPFLVGDLNSKPFYRSRSSNPKFWTPLPNRVLFAAHTKALGEELYVSDGTKLGTQLLKDILPGPASSKPLFMGKLGKFLYFTAEDAKGVPHFWVSDGTSLGTRPLSFWTLFRTGSKFSPLGVSQGAFSFVEHAPASSTRLFCSDGTFKGTRDLGLGLPSRKVFSQVVSVGRWTLFYASLRGEPASSDLYRSDGSFGGTRLLHHFSQHAIRDMKSDGKMVLFGGYDSAHGVEPWTSDGTVSGTKLFRDLVPGGISSAPEWFGRVGGQWVFLAYFGKPLVSGLWVSDGTPKGTRFVGSKTETSFRLWNFKQGSLHFTWSKGGKGHLWLLKPGAKQMQLIQIPPALSRISQAFLPVPGGAIGAFRPSTRSMETELLKIDFASGKASSLVPGSFPLEYLPGGDASWVQSGGKTLFSARQKGKFSNQPWISDGTPKGTREIVDLDPYRGTYDSSLGAAFSLGAQSFFLSFPSGGEGGYYSWAGAGKPLQKLVSHSKKKQSFLLHQGDYLFSFLQDGTELHRLDARMRALNPLLVGELPDPKNEWKTSSWMDLLGDRLLFTYKAKGSKLGEELYVSDGTPAGSKLLKDLNPGPSSSSPRGFHRLGSRVFFGAVDANGGRVPFASDGTPSGTRALGSVPQGAFLSPTPHGFVTWDGRAWFLGERWGNDIVFYTDPKAQGIQGFFPKTVGQGYTFQSFFHLYQGRLLLFGDQTPIHETLPWVFEIKARKGGYGLTRLDFLPPNLEVYEALNLEGGMLLVARNRNGRGSLEVWRSDGTKAGTRKLFVGYFFWEKKGFFLRIGSRRAVFRYGTELWVSDGTKLGTHRWDLDLRGKPLFTSPSIMGMGHGLLLFQARTERLGNEPWAWFPGAHGRPLGQGCGGSLLQTPELELSDPVLGKGFSASGRGAVPGKAGLLLLGRPSSRSTRLPSLASLPCRLFLDFRHFWLPLRSFKVGPAGGWMQRYQLPSLAVLRGETFAFQALFAMGASRFEVSNAYVATFGE